MALVKTCLNRLIGKCKDCKRDYNPKNRPNNYDCKDYYECHFNTFLVDENNLEKKL